MGIATLGIKDVTTDTFSTESERRGETIVIWLRGNADMAVHEHLKGFLEALAASTKRHPVKEIVFELQELYFMNSSCLSLLLRMINGVMETQDTHKCTVRFRSNPNLRWQKKSLQALHSYAEDIVVVE